MNEEERLGGATAASGDTADFMAERHAGLVRLSSLTAEARDWLTANISLEATWDDDAVIVEVRYFPALADAIIDAGYTFAQVSD